MKILACMISLFLSLSSFAMIIKGKVVDSNGEPIGGALVRVSPTNDAQTTNFMGGFNIYFTMAQPQDVVVIIVNAEGFDEKKINLSYTDDVVNMGEIKLGVFVDDTAPAFFTPASFALLTKPEEIDDQIHHLSKVEIFSVVDEDLRGFDQYQEELIDMPAFENITKKEIKAINGMIEYIKGNVPWDQIDIAISIIIKSDRDRTIYGYEAIYDTNDEKNCTDIYSFEGNLLSQKCVTNERGEESRN